MAKHKAKRRTNVVGTVYLLHFDKAYQHAKHYCGWTEGDDVVPRLAAHAAGQGARLTQVVKAAGISWTVARTWTKADRYEERRLKNRGGLSRQCPICRALAAKQAA